MKKTIVLLPGDGIGPEVTRAAATVLRECAHEFHHQFDFEEHPVGGAAIDVTATPLPNATLDACKKADAVFLGAVGGTKWDSLPVGKRPESGLLALRQGMGLYVNVRPVKVLEPLRGMSPLKPRGRQRARVGYGVLLCTGSGADCEVCLRAGGESVAPGVFRGQSERSGKFAAVAQDGDSAEFSLSVRQARTYVR